MEQQELKFLDSKGVEYLYQKLSMQDYPNNALLAAVINAINQEKADRTEVPRLQIITWEADD